MGEFLQYFLYPALIAALVVGLTALANWVVPRVRKAKEWGDTVEDLQDAVNKLSRRLTGLDRFVNEVLWSIGREPEEIQQRIMGRVRAQRPNGERGEE